MVKSEDYIDLENAPRHVAIIMDGNGRWAKERGAARVFGHRNAIKAVQNATEGCGELGIKYLTLYTFSAENWGRPQSEVDALMELLGETIETQLSMLSKNNVKLLLLGDITSLPDKSLIKLRNAQAETDANDGLHLSLALSYSGRWEITEAAKNMMRDAISNKLNPDSVTEDVFASYLQTASIPHPELLIRTGGEERISNFLLWQIAYTELFFTPTLWPDFQKKDLREAVKAFQKRERRFGKISPIIP